MTKAVYVTGCLGFIGYHLTKKCLDNDWYVYGIDKQTYASNIQLLDELKSYPKFKYSCLDINDIERIHDCDYFINTAAETHVDNSLNNPIAHYENNVKACLNLLTILKSEINKKKLKISRIYRIYHRISYGNKLASSHFLARASRIFYHRRKKSMILNFGERALLW